MDESTLARFMEKVEVQPNGCWHWTGKVNENGYGYFWFEGKSRLVHRFSYEQFVGPIPDEEQIDHACHTNDETCEGGPECMHRRCVNYSEDHLLSMSGYENIMRSNGVGPLNKLKLVCANGHDLTDESNVYLYPDGRERGCKTCRRDAWKRWNEKNRPADGPHNRDKTHCDAGHEFTEDNTYRAPNGRGRACKECRRIADAEAKRKQREAAKAAGLTVRGYLALKRV